MTAARITAAGLDVVADGTPDAVAGAVAAFTAALCAAGGRAEVRTLTTRDRTPRPRSRRSGGYQGVRPGRSNSQDGRDVRTMPIREPKAKVGAAFPTLPPIERRPFDPDRARKAAGE